MNENNTVAHTHSRWLESTTSIAHQKPSNPDMSNAIDMSKVHLSVNSQHGAMTRPATSTDVEYEREQVRSQMRARAARRVVKHACATGAHRHGRSKHHRCHRARVASQRPARVVSHDRTDAVHACPVKQRVLAYCDGLGSEHRRQSRGGRLRERAGIYTATPRCPNFSFL